MQNSIRIILKVETIISGSSLLSNIASMLRITEKNEQTFGKNFQKKGVRVFFKYHNHKKPAKISFCFNEEVMCISYHGLKSLPPSPKRAERKGRQRPLREAGSGHKQWNTVSYVDTFSIISKFSAQNSKI